MSIHAPKMTFWGDLTLKFGSVSTRLQNRSPYKYLLVHIV